MNEFTKEELQEILDLLKNGFGPNVRGLEVPRKIKSMIDNYCVPTIESWHCEKCGHVQ
jgi:hypothetical protein